MDTIHKILSYSTKIINYLENNYNLKNNLSIEDNQKIRNKFFQLCRIIEKKFNEIKDETNKFIQYEKELIEENNKYNSYHIHIPKTKTNQKYKEYIILKDKLIKGDHFIIKNDSILFLNGNIQNIIRYNKLCITEEINNKINLHICEIIDSSNNIKLKKINSIYKICNNEFLKKCGYNKQQPSNPKPFNINLFIL